MKKCIRLLTVVIACICLSGSVASAEVYSQIVGFLSLELQPDYNFIGLNFRNVENGPGYDIQQLFDTTTLNGGMTRAEADRLIMWDVAAQEYVELWLFDSNGNVPDFDGKWIDRESGDVAVREVSLGDGFWLINTTNETVGVMFSGEIEGLDSFTHVAMQGYSVIASAWPVDIAVNDIQLDGVTGGTTRAEADRMILWDSANQEYTELWLFDSGGNVPDFDGKWIDRDSGDVASGDLIVTAGSAVWIIKQTSDELVESKPF